MDREEANDLFQRASRHFSDGAFDEALGLLEKVSQHYGDNHRLVSARARTLGRLRRFDEALSLCDQLKHDFGYEKADAIRAEIEGWLREPVFAPVAPPHNFGAEDAPEVDDLSEAVETKRRLPVRIKPKRLMILVLLVAGMALHYVPYWLGCGIIAAYFLVKWLLWRLFLHLFSIPFRMKGKALKEAVAEVHAVLPAPPPENTEDDRKPGPKTYYRVEATITPSGRSEGFVCWEPGELVIAPFGLKVKNLDAHEQCFAVREVKILEGDTFREDQGDKLPGPQRLQFLVGLPEGPGRYKFLYYTEPFGDFSV